MEYRVVDLKIICKNNNLKGYSKLNKKQLIDFLLKNNINIYKDSEIEDTNNIKKDSEIEKIKGETKVVNIKVNYIRPQYQNLREWLEDKNNIYIGRYGRVFITNEKKEKIVFSYKSSIWENPYTIKKYGSREEVLKLYEEYIRQKIRDEPDIYDIKSLDGKNLGCWCKPDGCHGDILLKIINENN